MKVSNYLVSRHCLCSGLGWLISWIKSNLALCSTALGWRQSLCRGVLRMIDWICIPPPAGIKLLNLCMYSQNQHYIWGKPDRMNAELYRPLCMQAQVIAAGGPSRWARNEPDDSIRQWHSYGLCSHLHDDAEWTLQRSLMMPATVHSKHSSTATQSMRVILGCIWISIALTWSK